MTFFFEFIFDTRTIILIGGFITAIFGLLACLIKKDKPPQWISWLMFVGGIIVIIGGFKADVEQEQSTNLLLSKTELIANQADKIAILSQQNVDMSEFVANTVTGGSSFCYIHFGPEVGFTQNITRHLIHQGKYPIYNVSVRICDLNKFNNLLQKKEPLTSRKLSEIEEYYYYGILLPSKVIEISRILNPENIDSLKYNIFFSARNNDWVQETRIRRIEGKWKFATRVNGMGKELLLDISKDFPLNEKNEVEW